jgi:pyridinium-3,5-bisthiocarboxylic acid mononucleotide nickel chelatase
MKTLYFDCFSGVSGDMTIGALIDLGVSFEDLQAELQKLNLPGYSLNVEQVNRSNIAGTKFHVIVDEEHHHEEEHHEEEGHHHHHPHRALSDIYELIDKSRVSPWVKDTAKDIFYRLATAEGVVHGIVPEQVHFHEVGAIDAIVDIVGACICFELLGVELFLCSALHVGQGFVDCAHGSFPVPTPGTLELLKGVPIYSTEVEGELVTPTGAAIVSTLCSDFLPLPEMRIEAIGYGAGTREFEGFPNVLRLLYGEVKEMAEIESTISAQSETMMVVEANIDDMNPQIYGYLIDRILGEGAVDIFYTPIMMKKNRPGTLLTVLTERSSLEQVISVLLRETTTIGLRYYETKRRVLERQIFTVQTRFGPVNIKVALEGETIVNAMPEYEDCSELAQDADVPLAAVQAAAMTAFEDQRDVIERMITEGYNDEE